MTGEEGARKRSPLTLENLASYDDVITDALVDRVYYWTTIRKNRSRFSASRGIHEEDIADILRKSAIIEKDPAKAVSQLLQLPGLRSYVNRLPNQEEKDHFTRHMRRYLNIYMPDCPWEVTTTNRYMISEHEASITARKDIRKGEEIKYLTGVQVAMTKEQEESLDLSRKDFSIVVSSRKKTRSLFLGPARFANHDCNPNARLSTTGINGMQIVSVKNIEAGEEITVSYGEDYFGDDNEECLCLTCEMRQVNGWAPFRPANRSKEGTPEEEEEEEQQQQQQEEAATSGRKRKFTSISATTSRDGTPVSPDTKRAKLEVLDKSPIKRPESQVFGQRSLKRECGGSSLRQEIPLSSIEDPVVDLAPTIEISREIRTQQHVGLLAVGLDEGSPLSSTSPPLSSSAHSPKSSNSTDATSVDEYILMQEVVEKVQVEKDNTLVSGSAREVSTVGTNTSELQTSVPVDDEMSELSELSDSFELNDVLQKIVKRKKLRIPSLPRTTRSSSRNVLRIATPLPMDSIEDGYVANPRKPGDYTLTPLLLTTKHSRWVECRTCDSEFIEDNATHTHTECPRCERHSKLYGYVWPKTDKEGKHDKEERILDHRTVHRFIEPEEEKYIKKGRRGLKEYIKRRLSTPRYSREPTFSTEVETPPPKKRKYTRKTM
ncbi:hypothetical protein GQ43DRAFT_188738 [Delitschia confertaspora ATCC 74209]|uniref:Histone-lysine N-methyltransferase SET9 n=1 Tax=Delitschia confertaspora ATCC 74209 TaxID=1513339 RepID=A0A9P4JSB4_9PLEO|nr:hypothetical protein GQ43DRAFT_188738 [Delitschia confertaspora ATCC 74209]